MVAASRKNKAMTTEAKVTVVYNGTARTLYVPELGTFIQLEAGRSFRVPASVAGRLAAKVPGISLAAAFKAPPAEPAAPATKPVDATERPKPRKRK